MSRERNTTFLSNKKILTLCLRWHILRSYCFLAEVTFDISAFLNGHEQLRKAKVKESQAIGSVRLY